MRKYELTDKTINYDGHILHRIKALRDFGDVKAGDLGGYIESYSNLSHSGECWVYNQAKVYSHASVRNDAELHNCAEAKDYAIIEDKASLWDKAIVYDYACVVGNSVVSDDAKIYSLAVIKNCTVKDIAKVSISVNVPGNIRIRGNAVIEFEKDYIVFKNWWSSGRFFIWTRSNNMWSVGCFYGTGEELIKKAYKDSELSGHEYKRVVKYVESILKEEKK